MIVVEVVSKITAYCYKCIAIYDSAKTMKMSVTDRYLLPPILWTTVYVTSLVTLTFDLLIATCQRWKSQA